MAAPTFKSFLLHIALSSCVSSSTALEADVRADIVRGLVEGFVSETPDLADCLSTAGRDSHALGAAIEEIRQAIAKRSLRDFTAGLQDLDHAIHALPGISDACKAAEADVKDIIHTMQGIKNLRDLATHIWQDAEDNGKSLEFEMAAAAAAEQAKDFVEVGRRVGVALRLLLVGKAAHGSQPLIPKPPYNQHMRPLDLSNMTQAQPGDELEVYWLASPLLEEQLQDWGGALGLFHVSVGFRNLRTGMNSTFQFAAENFGESLVLPLLNSTDGNITWNNTGLLKSREGELDLNYWQIRLKIATVNGSTYNSVLSWMHMAKQKWTRYHLFGLATASGSSSGSAPQIPGFTCFEFAHAVVEEVARVAGPCALDRSGPGLVHNDILMLESQPSAREQASNEEAFNFYEAIEHIPDLDLRSHNFSQSMSELQRLAQQRQNGKMIFHDPAGKYWSFSPGRPFFSIRKSFATVPGTCASQTLLV